MIYAKVMSVLENNVQGDIPDLVNGLMEAWDAEERSIVSTLSVSKSENQVSIDTIAKGVPKYKCISCDLTPNESKSVVKHVIIIHVGIFCLNCYDWVQDKSRLLD